MADLKMCPTREQGIISRTPPHIHTLSDSSATDTHTHTDMNYLLLHLGEYHPRIKDGGEFSRFLAQTIIQKRFIHQNVVKYLCFLLPISPSVCHTFRVL